MLMRFECVRLNGWSDGNDLHTWLALSGWDHWVRAVMSLNRLQQHTKKHGFHSEASLRCDYCS